MQDTKRQILADVAEGRLTPEEAERRLAEIEETPVVTPAETAMQPATGLRAVRINRQAGGVDVYGDPSVLEAVAEGDHTAHREGDVLVIDANTPDLGFTFGKNNIQFVSGKRLTVRMNPDLALEASVQAGSLNVDSVAGAISADVQAGSAKLERFRGPIDVRVQAGSLKGTGTLDHGASRIRAEAGSVKLHLLRGSSVRIDVDSTMGSVSLPSGSRDSDVVGDGAATLHIDSTMGTVRVTAD